MRKKEEELREGGKKAGGKKGGSEEEAEKGGRGKGGRQKTWNDIPGIHKKHGRQIWIKSYAKNFIVSWGLPKFCFPYTLIRLH